MAPVMCREWSAGSLQGPASMRVVPRSMIRSRRMSRPGICNSIPGRFFYYSESISAREPDPESESA